MGRKPKQHSTLYYIIDLIGAGIAGGLSGFTIGGIGEHLFPNSNILEGIFDISLLIIWLIFWMRSNTHKIQYEDKHLGDCCEN